MTTPHSNTTPQKTTVPEATPQPIQTTQLLTLPLDGYSRASQLLPFLPIGVSTLWKWSKTGQFPAPVKLSATVTAWRNKDVHDWFNQQNERVKPTTATSINDAVCKEVA